MFLRKIPVNLLQEGMVFKNTFNPLSDIQSFKIEKIYNNDFKDGPYFEIRVLTTKQGLNPANFQIKQLTCNRFYQYFKHYYHVVAIEGFEL